MKKFLICEDDRDMVDFLKKYLPSKGYDFLIVEEGRMVLPALKNDHIQFLLLDLNLPDMDGRDVIKLLRSDPKTRDIPIILFTATARAEKIQEEFKIEGLLKKPFELEDLNQVIRKYC
ncbi:MAG: response regulator [Cyclobacteriaceae bacterium]|nr:response regulator [Cyclobacteriaceae bacterium]